MTRDRIAVRVSYRADTTREHSGEVVAVFSSSLGEESPGVWTAYAHHGQHMTASADYVRTRTRPATPDEYASLARELDAIGYDATPVRRLSRGPARDSHGVAL